MAKYLWLPNILSNDELILHKTFENIKTKIYAIHHGSTRLEHTAKIGNVNDEYGPSWFTRVSRRLVRTAETLWFHVTKEEALPVLSVIGTFVFILFVGYFLNYLMVEDRQRTFAQVLFAYWICNAICSTKSLMSTSKRNGIQKTRK